MINQQQRRAMNPMLLKVVVVSAAIHAVGLFILGGITVVKYIIPDDTQFEEAPEMTEEKPPPEVKIEIKPQERPKLEPMKNLRTRQVGNIAVDDISVDLPSAGDSFTINAGLGGFGGGSSLLGNSRERLDFGSSMVNVFGVKARTERLLFLIDTNRQMLTDKKGGLNSYRIIKDEITNMVAKLSAGTLFNVMLLDGTKTLHFKPGLVTAGNKSHAELVKWLAPINSNANNPGLQRIPRAVRPTLKTFTEHFLYPNLSLNFRGNETAFITQHALEQGIDTIFFITGYHQGFEKFNRNLNSEEAIDWQRKISSSEYKAQLAKHQLEIPQMEQRIRNKLNEINAQRRANGMPPRILDRRHGVYSAYRDIELDWYTEHPGFKPYPEVDPRILAKYFKDLNETLYKELGKPVPSINVVLFLAEDEVFNKQAEKQLKEYVRFYEGKHRILRGLKETQSASTKTPN
jgi:hypothetical protein